MRLFAVVLLGAVLSVCLLGCGAESQSRQDKPDAQETSTSQIQSDSELSRKVDYNGIGLSVNPSWKVDIDGKYPSITPSSSSKITLYTFIHDETENFDNLDEYILFAPSDYSLESEWEVEGATRVSEYTSKSDSGGLYTVAVGYNPASGAGFCMFLNRGDDGEKGALSDSVVDELLASIAFDPSSAKDDSIGTAKSTASGDGGNPSASASVSQQNALRSAKSYLDVMPFSYTGLIEQLEYEQYSTEDATYAADNCGANWNTQAEKSAESYIELMPFSRGELIDQLIYEGFTEEQAAHGADYVGL